MIALTNRFGRNALRAMVLAGAACAVSTAFATTGASAPRYDGLWSVSIVTEKGDCDRGYRYPIRISHGQLGNAGDAGFTITGVVGTGGFIKVTVSHGSASASGTGRLDGTLGTGAWAGNSCSGTWTAERRHS